MLGIIVDVLYGVCGQSCLDERVFAAASEGDAGLASRTATLEHACVAGADAERKGIGGDVRPCLVDHGNDAHGHRHALHAYTGVEGAAPAHASKRVILPGDLLEGGGNGLEAGGIEHEPVKKGARHACRARAFHVASVRGNDGGRPLADETGCGLYGCRPRRRRSLAHRMRRGPRKPARHQFPGTVLSRRA